MLSEPWLSDGGVRPEVARMWTLLWRRAPARAGASLVKGGLLGPKLVLGHGSTNVLMRLDCRTRPLRRPYHGWRPLRPLEESGRSPGAALE